MERTIIFMGWISFLLGSLLFVIDSIRQSNMMGILGGILFSLGCILFMSIEK